MKWFTELPQQPGEYLWMQVDLHCYPVQVVTVCLLDAYARIPDYIPKLGKSVAGENGGSYRYQAVDGTELVMCFGLQAPFVGPNGPEVDAWCKFEYPKFDHWRMKTENEWAGVISE